jgi:hypothetical protein
VLEKIPNSMGLNLEVLKEQQLQLTAYNKFLEKIHKQKLDLVIKEQTQDTTTWINGLIKLSTSYE